MSTTVLPLNLLCGASDAPDFVRFECSAVNVLGFVIYACDVDGDAVPCKWSFYSQVSNK